jgi:hypothetical protein
VPSGILNKSDKAIPQALHRMGIPTQDPSRWPRILHTINGFGTLGQVQVIRGTDTGTSHPLSSTELYQ